LNGRAESLLKCKCRNALKSLIGEILKINPIQRKRKNISLSKLFILTILKNAAEMLFF